MVHCCCAACIRLGALVSRQRSFFLCCDMYLRTRDCPVVLDIELSVSALYQKSRRVLVRVASSAAPTSCSSERRCAA